MLFKFFSFRYDRFEVLAVFTSTVLVMFGALFIVKERWDISLCWYQNVESEWNAVLTY